MPGWLIALLALIALVAALRVRALTRPVPFPPWMTPLLEVPGRNRDRMLRLAGLAPGERVLEIGPGAGWITERARERVEPGGRLVCLDLQRAMLRKVRARLGERTPWLVCASGSRLPFRDGAFDRVFLITVLGEIPDRAAAADELARVIRSGGELAIGEQVLDPDYVRAPVLERLLTGAGFRPGARSDRFYEYVWRFERP